MTNRRLWAMAAAAGISAALLTGCDDPGEAESPEQSEETEFDNNDGIDDDLEDNSRGEDELEDNSSGDEQPSDEATEPSE